MPRICIYFRKLPEEDRWVPGDRFIRPLVRRAVRGPEPIGGVERVFLNLCKGLDRIGVKYEVNPPFSSIKDGDKVAVLGIGRKSLEGYNRDNPIVAGIALCSHPSEWPDLLAQYPVSKYLQHSKWAADVYRPYYGDAVEEWAVGIDTDEWKPNGAIKTVDFLIYNKIRWNKDTLKHSLLDPIKNSLSERGLEFEIIDYGSYKPKDYKFAVGRAKSLLFLCEHESQGIAYQEAMSSGLPILAWDNGFCLDPRVRERSDTPVQASSVPFFSKECGETFVSFSDFEGKLETFLQRHRLYDPRGYVLRHLTLENSAKHFLRLLAIPD